MTTTNKKIVDWTTFPKPILLFRKYFVHNGHQLMPRSVGSAITMDEQGRINVKGDVMWRKHFPTQQLPIQFGKVSGSFNLNGSGISSAHGMPSEVGKSLLLMSLPNFPLQELPHKVGGEVWLDYNPQWPLLHLLQIQIGGRIFLYTGDPDQDQVLNTIMNRYRNKGYTGMVPCARELIKAGFKGNARL
jgi:hypothetical protein